MAERRNGTPSVEDLTRSGPQGSSGAIPNQRERSESTRRDGNSGGDNHDQDVTALLADTAGGNNADNPSPPQTLRHQQEAQHPNQSSTSRRSWWQKFVGGRSRTPRRQQEGRGRAETPGPTSRTVFSLGHRRPATASVYKRYASEYEEKGEEEQNPLRGDDYEREQTPAAPKTPLQGRQQGDSDHTNQYGRARPETRAQGRRTWTPLRQRAARATQEGRQEHTMTPGRRTRLAMGRGRPSGIQQVDARRDRRPAGLDLNPTPGGNYGGFTREEKTAGFDDAVKSHHPPPLATTPRHSRRIFHDSRAQTSGRARSAPVGPRLRDEEEEVIAQRRARWEKAVAAVNLRATRDKDEVDEVHWPNRVEPEDVCTQAPSTSKVRVTLFLQTGQRAREHANVLKTIFPHSVVLPCNGQGAWPGGESLRLLPGGTRRGVRLPDGSAPYSTIGPIAIVEDFPGGHLYDEVVAITSLSSRSRSTLETAFAVNSPGSACLIYHDKSEAPIATMSGDMTLTRRTGVDRGLLEDRPMAHTLTTIFEIKAAADAPEYPRGSDNEMYERPAETDPRTVARCVVAYRDASRWSSVGPSIRWFMVRRDYQGIGLAQQLFDEVEKWYVKNWTLSTSKGNRVLKATKLKDYIVDRSDEMEGRPPALITDKMFFYDVMNFKCILPSIPLSRAGFAKLGTYVPETHAIKIYPPTGEPVHVPTVKSSMPFKIGWRSCDSCKKPEDKPGMNLVCGRCTVPGYWRAHYCSRSCQYQDWPTHKLWCGKTLGEVLSASPFHHGTLQALE